MSNMHLPGAVLMEGPATAGFGVTRVYEARSGSEHSIPRHESELSRLSHAGPGRLGFGVNSGLSAVKELQRLLGLVEWD